MEADQVSAMIYFQPTLPGDTGDEVRSSDLLSPEIETRRFRGNIPTCTDERMVRWSVKSPNLASTSET